MMLVGIECLRTSSISQTAIKINPEKTTFRPAAISARLPSVLIFTTPYFMPLQRNISNGPGFNFLH
jgi:hypothetical protein